MDLETAAAIGHEQQTAISKPRVHLDGRIVRQTCPALVVEPDVPVAARIAGHRHAAVCIPYRPGKLDHAGRRGDQANGFVSVPCAMLLPFKGRQVQHQVWTRALAGNGHAAWPRVPYMVAGKGVDVVATLAFHPACAAFILAQPEPAVIIPESIPPAQALADQTRINARIVPVDQRLRPEAGDGKARRPDFFRNPMVFPERLP